MSLVISIVIWITVISSDRGCDISGFLGSRVLRVPEAPPERGAEPAPRSGWGRRRVRVAVVTTRQGGGDDTRQGGGDDTPPIKRAALGLMR